MKQIWMGRGDSKGLHIMALAFATVSNICIVSESTLEDIFSNSVHTPDDQHNGAIFFLFSLSVFLPIYFLFCVVRLN